MEKIQSTSDLLVKIAEDPQFEAEVKANPGEAIARVTESPLETDKWIYRVVVISLGLVALITLIGQITLTLRTEKTLSEGIIALASAAVGAMAGLLAPSPTRK